MAGCLKCNGTFQCPQCYPSAKFQPAGGEAGQVAEPCPDKCTASVFVRDTYSGKGVEGIKVVFKNGPNTDANGFAHFTGLDPGAHEVKISLAGLEARYVLARPGADKQSKTIAAGGSAFYAFEVDPLSSLEVTVARSDRDGLGLKDASVQLTEVGRAQITKVAAGDDGKVLFEKIRKSEVELKLEIKGTPKQRFRINERFDEHKRISDDVATSTVSIDLGKAKNEAKFLVTPHIFLKLQIKDPEGTARAFPKGFPLTVVFQPSNSTTEVEVLDDLGQLHFVAAKAQTHFTLKFDSTKLRLLSLPKDATKFELVEDADEERLQKLTLAEARFFALPKKWSLVHAAWDAANLTLPVDGKVAIPVEGVGTESTPGALTLTPKIQHARFQFHDRKHGPTDHANAQVGIPAVVLKGARTFNAVTGVVVDPIAGTHDALSNWMISPADNAAACQALPWIVTRKDDGVDLPRLSKAMVLEFGWKDGYVVCNGPGGGARVIETIAAIDPRRKPNKDRHKYYDLPAVWRSTCYYTRLPGGDATPANNRFFDELTDDQIDASMSSASPLKFSLDDIVLVQGASQTISDLTRDVAALALNQFSRVAILHLDRANRYKVKVYKPFGTAPYFSDSMFAKDQRVDPVLPTLAPRRNVLTDYPGNARAVVFCSGFHDIFDKRTTAANFASLEILGARAAVLDDDKISEARVFDQGTDVTKGYVHRTRAFELHYLHYCDSDGTTVYGALVTHWSAVIFSRDTERPADINLFPPAPPTPYYGSPSTYAVTGNALHARNYREIGLGNAMTRWNEKDYQFEEQNAGTDVVIKAFCLFEAKEVESPVGTFRQGGGAPHGYIGVGGTRSSATDVWMHMRQAAYANEASRGDGTMPDLHAVEHPSLVIAHELGHLAMGLWDDYVTQKWSGLVPGYNQRSNNGAVVPQRYPGIPYNRDAPSMMNPNRSPRLRMFWGRANWLNDESAGNGAISRFTQGKRFKVTWDSPLGKLNFHLDESARNIYVPAHRTANHSFGEQGAATLYLYKLGEDEFARQMPGGPYKGMLVLEPRLCVRSRTGLHPIVDTWAPSQAYVAGNCVEYCAKFYTCVEAHTSYATGKPPTVAQWFEVKPEVTDATPVAPWAATTAMQASHWFSSGGQHYVCRRAHTAGERITEFFQGVPSPTAWVTKTRYALQQTVTAGGQLMRCKRAHKSGKVADPAFWDSLGADRGAYAGGVALAQGDLVSQGGAHHVCTVAHTTGSLAADVAVGRMAACNRAPRNTWASTVPNPENPAGAQVSKLVFWVNNANTELVNAVEGDGTGKMKLVSAGAEFSPCYVRMFAQWAHKALATDPDPPDTLFTIDVVEGGGAACFAASGRTISVGSETNAKTLARYLFGKLSADPDVRAGQNLVNDLVPVDLVTLAKWMNDRVPGANYQPATIP